jgi:hypothetical protein
MKALYFPFFSLLLAVPLGALTYTGDAWRQALATSCTGTGCCSGYGYSCQ